MRTFYLSLGILVFTSCAFGQTTAGTLEGVVTEEGGAPIEGATVLYRRITRMVRTGASLRLAPGEAVVDRTVSSDANGAFAVPNLPTGDYLVCVAIPSAAYLNPCQWSSAPKATISAGAVSRQSLILKRGVFLRVRVDDPAGLLPTVKDRPVGGTRLIVGVMFGNGAFINAVNIGVDKIGRDYEMVIPADKRLDLWLFSRHVTLMNSDGYPLDHTGAKIPFQAKAGQDQLFTLRVSGRAPEAENPR